jgi:hypothetical protein
LIRTIPPLLWASAAAFLAIGVFFIGWPVRAANSISLVMSDDVGHIDLRATYGGMCLGVGLFYGWLAREPDSLRTGAMSLFFIYGGLGLIRGLSIAQGYEPNGWMWSFLVIEFAVAAAALIAFQQLPTES